MSEGKRVLRQYSMEFKIDAAVAERLWTVSETLMDVRYDAQPTP